MIDIKELTEDMMKKMREVVESKQDALPVIFVIDKDEKIQVIGVPLDDKNKDAVGTLIKMLVSMPQTTSVLFLCDAWTKSGEAADKDELDRLRDQYGEVRCMPGRKEAITCTISGRGMKPQMASWTYDRDKDDNPVFHEKIEWMGGNDNAELTGRFVVNQEVGGNA